MKLFLFPFFKTKIIPIAIVLLLLLSSCATKHAQFGKNHSNEIALQIADTSTQIVDTSKITHTLYLIGDVGNADEPQAKHTLDLLEKRIKKSDKKSTLLFLGDNIYPHGFPDKNDDKKFKLAESKLNNQLAITKKFKGKTIFIPGEHDWDNGLDGLQRESNYITDSRSHYKRNLNPYCS